MKHHKILRKIKRVEEIPFKDLEKLIKELGGIIVNGAGSTYKINLNGGVITLHTSGKILTYGMVRTVKESFVKLNIF